MEAIDIRLKTINPPVVLVKAWARGIPGKGNPSHYMRECYMQYGADEGARLMLEAVLNYICTLPSDDLDLGKMIRAFDAYLNLPQPNP